MLHEAYRRVQTSSLAPKDYRSFKKAPYLVRLKSLPVALKKINRRKAELGFESADELTSLISGTGIICTNELMIPICLLMLPFSLLEAMIPLPVRAAISSRVQILMKLIRPQ